MRKPMLYLGLLSFVLISACKEKEVRTESVDTKTVETETVRTEPADTVVVKEEESDGTSVKVGEDGVSVDSKNGNNSVDVKVK